MNSTGSVQAQNRTVEQWFSLVRAGTLRLPRFQRHEAWDRGTVVSLIETVLRGLPSGAALVLNVGEPAPFISRHLVTAPQVDGRVTEHLLDGQQRLTALWRSLYDTYGDLTLFVSWQPDPDHEGEETVVVTSQPRWRRKGVRYPVWCDDPKSVMGRGMIPLRLLAPDAHAKANEWLKEACDDLADAFTWSSKLDALRHRISTYNIPYLHLPETTPRDVALDVFIKMNTSNIRLTAFDIVVAQVEAAAGSSMHDILEEIRTEVPRSDSYGDLGTLLLDVSCLRSGRVASKANYLRLDYGSLPDQWLGMVGSLRFMTSLLETESVFDEQRLPSSSVVPVITALAADLPAAGDALGNARTLLRYYLWRAFLTRRYESSTATRAFQDYQALRSAIMQNSPLLKVSAPIFDEAAYPVPSAEQLLTARWPKTRDILARGVLALSLKEGGRDIADDTPASRDSVKQREYHHLFPDSILVQRAGLGDEDSYRALNCALITWQTNRHVSNRSPLEYLSDRVTKANLGESEVKARLESHLIPWDKLKSSGPYADGEDSTRIRSDYEQFLWDRAELVAVRAAERAGTGKVGVSAGADATSEAGDSEGEPTKVSTQSEPAQPAEADATPPPDTPESATAMTGEGAQPLPDVDKAFAQAMKGVYERAKREAGYPANIYLRMLSEHGPMGTARRLLASDTVSDGFVALWERGRMDLTVENVVLRPEFESLFSDDDREIARRRLAEYGYFGG